MTPQRAFIAGFFVLALMIVSGFAALTNARELPAGYLAGLQGDAKRGEYIFAAAGCASCHLAPEADWAAGSLPALPGGRRFPSPFGTFIAPNISTDTTAGIGAWSDRDIVRAITLGASPEGSHYYPAFPYASFQRAASSDIADLIAYLRTLPAVSSTPPPHEVGFPFNIRRTLAFWKALFTNPAPVLPDPLPDDIARGRYLVEALGHCGECHTPRNALGGLKRTAWLGGAPHPSGEGRIPNITSASLNWSIEEIAAYLQSGFTPEFDVAGGEMIEVIANTSRLSDDDRMAIARYLKAVPPVE